MVDQVKLYELNNDIFIKGRVDREHLLAFLRLIPTNDGQQVVAEVRKWLKALSDDPKYDKVILPDSDIDAVITDLESYGRVMPNTILGLQHPSSRDLRAS